MADIKKTNSKRLLIQSISTFHQNKKDSKTTLLRLSPYKSKNKKEKIDNNILFLSHINDSLYSRALLVKRSYSKKEKKSGRNSIINNEKDKKMDINYFYYLRRKITSNFRKVYSNPYIEHLIKKGLYKNCNEDDYPKYYNYYQIHHLMNKKKFRLSIMYDDFLLFSDEQEYLLKYLGNNEQ
jgi:hypothetical protein